MVRPLTKYECPECCEVHDDPSDAETCCPPEVDTVYECAVCEETWMSHLNADMCCVDLEDC